MAGSPAEIHLKENMAPIAKHEAIPVPIHWQGQEHSDLLCDESLGVIERVPFGESVEWCPCILVTWKHDGSPRRTVDLSLLNKHCQREIHNAESPFHLARRIPHNTWKTVTDVWNAYQRAVAIIWLPSENVYHPFWRYKRAAQRFVSSGDGYNCWFDAILADFDQEEHIVHDTIFYDNDLEDHWWRTIDFLVIVGWAGIVLNPNKF